MSPAARNPDSGENEVDRIIADYVRARERGESVDLESLVAEYPDHEEALREFARDYEWIGTPAGPRVSANGLFSFEAGQEFGPYRMVREIARGGMGVVYRARRTDGEQDVALKVLRAGELASRGETERFRQEIQAASRLRHPGIVPVLEAGEVSGLLYLAMPLIEGGTLASVIPEYRWNPRAAASLILNLARAIESAHSEGIVHRDLKPANVLIGLDGRPRVTDFGLSRVESLSTSLTMTVCGPANPLADPAKSQRATVN